MRKKLSPIKDVSRSASENVSGPVPNGFTLTRPTLSTEYPQVLLAHGGGGKLMHSLIEQLFMETFKNPLLEARHDGAVLNVNGTRLAFTTDSYVVRPLFFPGGDIGKLAVNGTVNDLAMCGARPLVLSAGFILEEGVSMETVSKVVRSMQEAAAEAQVQIVTGDTKVVDKGKGDGIFINTAGIGVMEHDLKIDPGQVKIGDAVIVNGDLGRHGIAIMGVREGLAFETEIESDCAPLSGLVLELLSEGIPIHCMRDLTRGGLASALNEIAEVAGVEIHLEEKKIPVRQDVQGACEILGLDPLYVANEGRFITFVSQANSERTLRVMQSHALGADARIIGQVTQAHKPGFVTIKTKLGTSRIIDLLSGEQLPRIC